MAQVYGRNVLYKRDSLAVLSAIEDADAQRTALDDKDAWPGWMSNRALWIFPAENRWRRDIQALVARTEYSVVCSIVVAVSILGIFLTPQAQLVPESSTQVRPLRRTGM